MSSLTQAGCVSHAAIRGEDKKKKENCQRKHSLRSLLLYFGFGHFTPSYLNRK